MMESGKPRCRAKLFLFQVVRLNVFEFLVVILLQSSDNFVEICSRYLKLTFVLVTPSFVNIKIKRINF